MRRVIISPQEEGGLVRGQMDPLFLYLDTSAWIDIVEAHVRDKQSVLTQLKEKIGKPFHIALSIFNIVELIRPKASETTRFYTQESMGAFTMIPMIGLRSTWLLIEDEIGSFIASKLPDTRILDDSTLKLFQDGYEKCKANDLQWFTNLRQQFDHLAKKDKNQDLSADVDEHGRDWSKVSYRQFREELRLLRNASPEDAAQHRSELTKKKSALPNPKSDPRKIPIEESEVVKYARYRIQESLGRRHGIDQISTLQSTPKLDFPGRAELVKDWLKIQSLTAKQLRARLPSLYWMCKVSYWNYFHAPQGDSGKLGDRNHAVYFPQVNYFATSDGALAAAFGSERSSVFTHGKIRVFDCRRP